MGRVEQVNCNLSEKGEGIIKKKLKLSGNTSLFHVREDLKVIMQYCNMLADENEMLKDRIIKLEEDLKDTKSCNHLN